MPVAGLATPSQVDVSLGQLALHVAAIPGDLSRLAEMDGLDTATVNFEPPTAQDADELLSSLDRSVSASKEFLGHLTPSQAEAPWRLTMRGQDVCTVYGRSADDDPFV
ncbi:MAG: hypothetical protein KA371_08375 [Acidobacteria bacterium]|nr:hypothetical protein [Acidobacteriota bacterium]